MYTGKEEPGLTREELQEQERLRKEAILLAERERHKKYRKQDEEREVVRQKIREKVRFQKYSADIYCQVCILYCSTILRNPSQKTMMMKMTMMTTHLDQRKLLKRMMLLSVSEEYLTKLRSILNNKEQ